MSAAPGRRARAGLAVPALFALAALATFIGLGTWQIQRKAWKETLIDTLERRLSDTPVDLPPSDRWAGLNSINDEFRRVKFSASFVPGAEALVYASGSALRSDVSGPGYWVFAPARLAAGALVVVNRGFVPEGRQDPATRIAGEVTSRIDIVGVMRWPEPSGVFTPEHDPARNLWFVRNPAAIAGAKGWGRVAPFFVELESPSPPGGLPQAGALKATLRNEHLQYAITWYGLAAVVTVMFVLWLRGRRRALDPE
jgi:surfeit locus 1 family protein